MSPAKIMTPSLRVMQMREKEKEGEVFAAERFETWKNLMKRRKKPRNAAEDTGRR